MAAANAALFLLSVPSVFFFVSFVLAPACRCVSILVGHKVHRANIHESETRDKSLRNVFAVKR